MRELFIQFYEFAQPEFTVALMSMLPFTELRASLPLAIFVFEMSPLRAFVWTLAGNLVPMFALVAILPSLITLAHKRIPVLKRLMDGYFRRLSARHEQRYHRLGAILLFVLVAIPLPGTGVWTASILTVIFKIRLRSALIAMTAGLVVSAIIVLTLTVYAYIY